MPLHFFVFNDFIWFIPSFSCNLVMTEFSHSLMHILTLFFFFFLEFCFTSVAEILHPLHLFPNPSMARTRRAHSFRPRVPPSSPPPTTGQSTPPATAVATSHAPVPVASAPRRYDTWVGPTLPSLAYLRPSRRSLSPTKARTSDPGKSSSSRPHEPHSPPVQGPADDLPPNLSPASIIQRPFFHRGPTTGNSDCSTREVHYETYYDFLAFVADPELRDSMRLVQRYSLEPFMTSRRFFYP